MQATESEDKTLKYWLRVNWKKETISARKTEPSRSELGPYELVVESELQIHKPKVEVPKLSAELSIPEPRIRRIIAESMDADADFPDWFGTVDEVFDNHPDLVEERQVDALMGKVMLEDPGSPDPVAVHDEVQKRVWEQNGE